LFASIRAEVKFALDLAVWQCKEYFSLGCSPECPRFNVEDSPDGGRLLSGQTLQKQPHREVFGLTDELSVRFPEKFLECDVRIDGCRASFPDRDT